MAKGPLISMIEDDDCLFCLKFGRLGIWKMNFRPLLNKVQQEKITKALFSKYSTTHSKHIEMDLNTLIQNSPVPWVIQFKDQIHIEEKEEFLKRQISLAQIISYYSKKDHRRKFEQLLEYYKFHIDLPRNFIRKVLRVSTFYYERKKQLKYKSIKKQLGLHVEETVTLNESNTNNFDFQDTYNTEMYNANQNLLKNIQGPTSRRKEVSMRDMLKDLVKDSDEQCNKINISQTWLSMLKLINADEKQSQILKSLKKQPSTNLMRTQKFRTQPSKQTGHAEFRDLAQQRLQGIQPVKLHKLLTKCTSERSPILCHSPLPVQSPYVQQQSSPTSNQKITKSQIGGSKQSRKVSQHHESNQQPERSKQQQQKNLAFKQFLITQLQQFQPKPVIKQIQSPKEVMIMLQKRISQHNLLINSKPPDSTKSTQSMHRKSQTQYSEGSPSPICKSSTKSNFQSQKKLNQLILPNENVVINLKRNFKGQSASNINININQLNLNMQSSKSNMSRSPINRQSIGKITENFSTAYYHQHNKNQKSLQTVPSPISASKKSGFARKQSKQSS